MFGPTFDIHPMATSSLSLAQQGLHSGMTTPTRTPRAGASAGFGIARQTAWGVDRGPGAPVQSLNANNSGSFMKFDGGPSFQPVEMR
ncbi:hypothetical protein UFOVP45_80 [uncultured Caudovirales phage]|uniref:Uncharacterized protein n=1 Tax=uncultured Caudovirales phage TaxID=2100421 RepID=A0A6J5KSS2_9CAUD|nr:hypothetical protein UFOVP45_80 [uncultured Caudovirales phage]